MKNKQILILIIILSSAAILFCCKDPDNLGYGGPEITDISPAEGYVNDVVTITGKNFAPSKEGNTVRFGEHIALVKEASETVLKVVVPNGSGEVNVTVATEVATSDGKAFKFLVPTLTLTSIEPNIGLEGDVVVLKGDNFNDNPANNLVRFNDVVADVTEASKSELKVVVPEGRGTVNVTVTVGRSSSAALEFIYTVGKTVIISITPSAAFPGDEVVISGAFKSPTEENKVTFGGVEAELLQSSESELKVKVPAGSGTVDVVVTSADDSSEPFKFTYASIELSELSPDKAEVFDTLYLRGVGFSVVADENKVLFGGDEAKVMAASADELKVVVPEFTGNDADIFVSVTVGGNISNGLKFHLLQYYTEVIAGSGVKGTSVSTVNAMDADMNQPMSLAFDGNGNLYFSEGSGAIIRRLTPDGKIEFIAGNYAVYGSQDGEGTEATFKYPYGIVVDNSGNIYVADVTNKLIRKVTPDGVVTTIAGSTTSKSAQDGTATAATFYNPYSITMDNDGNLIVGDMYSIRKITIPDYVVTTIVGDDLNSPNHGSLTSFNCPRGLAVAPDGTIYVSDSYNNCVKKIAPDLTVSIMAGPEDRTKLGHMDGPASEALFYNPQGLVLAADGTVFVTDGTKNINYYLRKISPDGYVTSVMGVGSIEEYVPEGLATTVPYRGWGVAMDKDENIYLTDLQHLRIRKVYLK